MDRHQAKKSARFGPLNSWPPGELGLNGADLQKPQGPRLARPRRILYRYYMFCGALMACSLIHAAKRGLLAILGPALLLGALITRLSRPRA
jgi:hypothetical protein